MVSLLDLFQLPFSYDFHCLIILPMHSRDIFYKVFPATKSGFSSDDALCHSLELFECTSCRQCTYFFISLESTIAVLP